MVTGLQFFNFIAAVAEFGMLIVSRLQPEKFNELFAPLAGRNPSLERVQLMGTIMFLHGIMRLHGALNIFEKGAYRVALWSWILELAMLVEEVYRNKSEFAAVAPAVAITSAATVWHIAQYGSYLYPKGEAAKKKS
jgi:hypothetical protein